MNDGLGTRLAGRRILICGAASGIGRATATLFAREGAQLALMDRDRTALHPFAEQLNAAAFEADIACETEVERGVNAANAEMGGLDGLVITAGIFDAANLQDTSPALWNKVIAVNLTGTYLLCRAALPHLRRNGGASIVTLGSGVALVPSGPNAAAYVAAKGGVIALSRQIAQEAAPHVRVNCICPGMVDTPMTQSFIKDASGTTLNAVNDCYALKRTASPDEIAAAILFMTSTESSFVTGTTLAVDGGRTFH